MRRTFSFTERFLTIIQILPHFIETRKEVGYVTCPKSRRANRAFDIRAARSPNNHLFILLQRKSSKQINYDLGFRNDSGNGSKNPLHHMHCM